MQSPNAENIFSFCKASVIYLVFSFLLAYFLKIEISFTGSFFRLTYDVCPKYKHFYFTIMSPINKLSCFERISIFACLACFGLLVYRCIFSLSFDYTFLMWNLAVAIIPYLISKKLSTRKKPSLREFGLVLLWLLFFPCCIFLFIGLLQIHRHETFPFAYDLLLLVSFAIAGIIPGLMSLKKVEFFLGTYFHPFLVKLFIVSTIFLSSYNIALIRFLHLKNWDIAENEKKLPRVSHINPLSPEMTPDAWLQRIFLVVCIIIMYVIFNRFYPPLKHKV